VGLQVGGHGARVGPAMARSAAPDARRRRDGGSRAAAASADGAGAKRGATGW
jgi:hypothetical protein